LAEPFLPKLIVLNRILKLKAEIFTISIEKYDKINIFKRKKIRKWIKYV
jgi:hypothetical protein